MKAAIPEGKSLHEWEKSKQAACSSRPGFHTVWQEEKHIRGRNLKWYQDHSSPYKSERLLNLVGNQRNKYEGSSYMLQLRFNENQLMK